MTTTLALELNLGAIKTIGAIVIGVLLLLAVLFAVIMKAVVGKVISVVFLLGLAIAVYTQRGAVEDCELGTTCTFFGVDVDVPNPNPN